MSNNEEVKIIDINDEEVKVHNIIRLYSSYFFVVEEGGKLYAIALEHQPHFHSMGVLNGEFEIVKDINQLWK